MANLRDKIPTKKQIDFAEAYVSNGFVAKQAALSAGYSHHVSRRGKALLHENKGLHETIGKAVDKARSTIFDRVGAAFEKRVEKLWLLIVDIIPDNQPIRHQHAGNAIKAIAELNKMAGDYAPDKSLRLNVTMTKDKLLEAKKTYEDF